jgi:hypothetical protein
MIFAPIRAPASSNIFNYPLSDYCEATGLVRTHCKVAFHTSLRVILRARLLQFRLQYWLQFRLQVRLQVRLYV